MRTSIFLLVPHISFLIICIYMLFSCNRIAESQASKEEDPSLVPWKGAYPAAILQTGEYPLWFQLTENGPVHVSNTGDSRDLVPWPYAPHVSFMENINGELIVVVNRFGFLKLAAESGGLALYVFSGGEFWNEYTSGGFVFFEGGPAALIYPENHFLDTLLPQRRSPLYRTWSFNMNSNTPFVLDIPALQFFPQDEGWIINSLRQREDGYFYYRARNSDTGDVYMFRTINLAHAGEEISIEVFYDSYPLQKDYSHPALPPLPDGFVYTGMCYITDNIFASWEEQIDYSIGAAGFVVIKP